MTVETDILLLSDELRQLVERRGARLAAAVRAERRARAAGARRARARRRLNRELETRQIEVANDIGEDGETRPAPFVEQPLSQLSWETTTDALQLFLREAGRHPLLDRRPGGRARQADRARRPDRQAADDPVEPAPRRLDRQELPQPGPAVPRPDPGRDARADPRRREVRLAPRLQVLDVRHLVDPPGGRPRARRQGADDPHAGPHRRAAAEDEPRRAVALGVLGREPTLEEIADEANLPAPAGEGGARRSPCLDLARRAGRRGRRRRARRLRRRRRAASGRAGRGVTALADARRGAPLAARTGTARSSSSATGSTTPTRRRSRRSAAGSA